MGSRRVPAFSPGPAFLAADHSSKRGAERACAQLKARWLCAGWSTAQFRVEQVAHHANTPIYGIRSNLVNGMPPAAPKEVPWAE